MRMDHTKRIVLFEGAIKACLRFISTPFPSLLINSRNRDAKSDMLRWRPYRVKREDSVHFVFISASGRRRGAPEVDLLSLSQHVSPAERMTIHSCGRLMKVW